MNKKIINVLFLSMMISVAGQGGGPSGPQITGGDPSVLPKILPSSPEAYKLGSYGNIPVSLFTGTANVNIPLTAFKTANLTLPVEINYASNGIKIDDMNGSTGLGWGLVTGGVITRTIRDLPDEENTNISFPADIDALGIRHPTVMQYFQDASNDLVDSEQDLYMASFNGNSIRFLFDRRGMPVVYSQKDVKIEGQSGGNAFTITMEDGVKYYFTDKETTNNRTQGDGHSLLSSNTTAWYLTKIEDPSSGEEINIENQAAGYSTTLSRSQIMKYTIGPAQQSVCGGPAFSLPPIVGELISHLQSVSGKQIKRIYSNNPNYGEIIFDYALSNGNEDYQKLARIQKKINSAAINDINFDYTLTANKRLFLNSINDVVSKSVHSFTYNTPEEFPERLSFARDTGGYYNGVTANTNLIPQMQTNLISYVGASQGVVPTKTQIGMLTKIVYPTKGSSEFFYENNTTTVNKIIIPAQNGGLSMGAESIDIDFGSPNQTNSQTFTSSKDGEIPLGGGSSFNAWKCPPELEVTGKHRAGVTLTRPNGEFIPFYRKNPDGSHIATGITHVLPISGTPFFAEIPKNELLKLTIKTAFECTRASVAASWPMSDPVWGDVQANIEGLRISKIVDNSENGIATTRKFLYKDVDGQYSNAIRARQPTFTEVLNKTKTCISTPPAGSTGGAIPYGLERFTYNALTSSNINQLNALHPNLFYKTVQEIVEGKSKIVHTYSIDTDYFGEVRHGVNIKSAPWTNFGWNNGREILTKYLDNNNNVVRTVENNYVEDNARKVQVDGFAIRKNYDNPVVQNVTKTCKIEDLDDTIDATYCTANHAHIWSTTDWYKNCHAIGAQNVTQTYKGACYGKNVGDVVVFEDRLDNLDVVQYKNISHFDYLKSQKVTDYLNGVPVKEETQYFYNNPLHHQLVSKKTIHPDLVTNESTYAYAHEKGNQLMIDKNMVGIPLETVETQTDGSITKTLDKTETIYPTSLPTTPTGNLILPLSVKSYDVLSNISSTDVTFDKYDEKGNILQYTAKDGTPVAIIWGYNKTEPIAQIEGMTYAQVTALPSVSSIISASDNDALDPSKENLLLDALNNFRKEPALTGKQISTYTYDPLIGVTSITPPSGVRQIFVYDAAGRLKEGNIRLQNTTGGYIQKTARKNNYQYKQ